ncbi:sensor histidine kinase [Caulobacter hibisci]|uniref:histidine kinase n=1 Tax=Caulobacter hibisci TaxID=2035993 RepID=A0ABS0T417_9CAUL|nr:ATP-binding protein [Caulobacter hibisci]MBI1686236.1 PAS domain-containing protein [Caulobacter hibisci]
MPTVSPPSPVAPERWGDALAGAWAGAWTAVAAGPAALVAMAALGAAKPGVALPAAVLLGGGGIFLLRRLRRGIEGQALAAAPAAAATDRAPPFATILENLPEPLMVIAAEEADDLTGRRFVFANGAARERFRIREGALLVTAVRSPQVLEAVDESLFGGLERTVEWTGVGSQGRDWTAHSRPLGRDDRGSQLALLVLRDETDVRRTERTRADFLANASHELRTPLASLSGFIETLRGHAKEDPGARDKFLGIMQAQAERMSRLIDDLMSLSRIELNEHIAPAGRVDLAMAAEDVIDALAPQARDKAVTFDSILPPRGAAVVEGDRDQIVQVIQNLVDNAIKYTPKEGVVRVEIFPGLTAGTASAARDPAAARLSLLTPDLSDRDERYAGLRVSDKGPGIAREHLPRLTERFYRVEGQKSGERQGTGLGLAIVKHIINRHHGGLHVESLQGEGTTFGVYLPMAKSLPQKDLATADGATPGGVVKLS